MKRIVIVSAKRTPFGRFRGGMSKFSPVELAVAAGNAALEKIDRTKIDQLLLGNVLSAGHGMNVARQVAVNLSLPIAVPATTINMMCGSGMQSARMAVSAIRAGEANAILAGGTESMSRSHLLVPRPPKKQSPDFENEIDSMQIDGLIDSFSGRHMGEQAEELASVFQISRAEQDAFARRSQQLYGAAQESGSFADEIIPIGDLGADEHPRPDITLSDLGALPTVFDRQGSVTAGNSSGINDGAAMFLIAERDFALAQGWPILAEWIDGVAVGCDPARMGLGPVHAVRSLLQKTDRSWDQIDTLEINEAFAAQALACLKELEFAIDLNGSGSKVTTSTGNQLAFNAEGGAIALGHPLSASGARVLCHLAHTIARGESNCAIGALCIGGGMGIAALLGRAD